MTSLAPVLFSAITPVFDPAPTHLREYLDSLLRQDYPQWELCLVDDGSKQDAVRDIMREYAAFDPRIHVRFLDSNSGISAASNAALAMATGDWVVPADHDDILAPILLSELAGAIERRPEVQIVYTDEDKFDRPFHHFDAFHKPDWSPETLQGQMYAGHITAYRRTLMERLGGYRSDFDGAQDWDLLLRAAEVTNEVHHVRQVLYHWRHHPHSTSQGVDVKPYALEAGRRAVQDALDRRGVDGWVEDIPEYSGYFGVRRRLQHEPLVSVIIPTIGVRREVRGADVRMVDLAIQGLLRRTDYANVEIIVVLGENCDVDVEPTLRQMVERHGRHHIDFVHEHGRFDFSRAINRGVVRSTGSLVLLLNDDVEPVSPDWLHRLVEAVQDPEVGVAGGRLLFEDGSIQHAGVAHNVALPYHPQRGDANGEGYFGEVVVTRNYLAVTGACLLTPRAVFDDVGGLSPLFPVNYNDIDYCLKVVESGRRVAYVGQAVLHHYESTSREPSVSVGEITEWHRWWDHLVFADPFFPAIRASANAPH